MNLLEKTISFVSPKWAASRAKHRLQATAAQSYAYKAGDRSSRQRRNFTPPITEPNDEIAEIPDIRARSRHLIRNHPVASAAISVPTNSVVNTGIRVQPRIDHEALGIPEERAKMYERILEKRFNAYAESTDCDVRRELNFYGIQDLTFKSMLASGDCFVLPQNEDKLFSLKVIEADRCETPLDQINSPGDQTVVGGVKSDKNGRPLSFFFRKANSESLDEYDEVLSEIEILGGIRIKNVMQLMRTERPDQARGIPFLSGVIDILNQLDRYTDAELAAANLAGKLVAFLEMQPGEEEIGDPDDDGELNAPEDAEAVSRDLQGIDNASVVELAEGEKANIPPLGRPNVNYEPFVSANLKLVAMGLGIPYEVLIRHFTSSYSASRAARVEYLITVMVLRSLVVQRLNKPVYERFVIESVLAGELELPGFFQSEEIRKAYLGADWVGPSLGLLDPVKEIQASILKVDNLFSTRQKEVARLDGEDFERMVPQMRKEHGLVKELRAVSEPPQIVEEPEQDTEEDAGNQDDDESNKEAA